MKFDISDSMGRDNNETEKKLVYCMHRTTYEKVKPHDLSENLAIAGDV